MKRNVCIQSSDGGGFWSEFLSFNLPAEHIGIVVDHYSKRADDNVRMIIGPAAADDAEAENEHDVLMQLGTNW